MHDSYFPYLLLSPEKCLSAALYLTELIVIKNLNWINSPMGKNSAKNAFHCFIQLSVCIFVCDRSMCLSILSCRECCNVEIIFQFFYSQIYINREHQAWFNHRSRVNLIMQIACPNRKFMRCIQFQEGKGKISKNIWTAYNGSYSKMKVFNFWIVRKWLFTESLSDTSPYHT